MPPESSRTVKATETSIAILEALQATGGAGVTELAERLDFSKGNVYRHLQTLERAEFVVEDGDTYALSYRYLEWGMSKRRSSPVAGRVTPMVATLADAIGNTVFFAVEEHDRIVYLIVEHGGDERTVDVEGTRLPLDETASGRLVLALREGSDRDREQADAGPPVNGVDGADLRQIRTRKLAIERDARDGYSEIAVPVIVTDGEPVGVLGLFADDRAEAELANEYRRLLGSTSERIARRIGWERD